MKTTIARFGTGGLRGLRVMRRLARTLPCRVVSPDCTTLLLEGNVILRLAPSEYHETMDIVREAA